MHAWPNGRIIAIKNTLLTSLPYHFNPTVAKKTFQVMNMQSAKILAGQPPKLA
jgi:hypothetical protein